MHILLAKAEEYGAENDKARGEETVDPCYPN